jgi:periplasmic divalent cation tolerance protein
MKNKYLMVFCSCPDKVVADRLCQVLVEERLAACVSQISGLTSVYWWEGQVRKDEEVLLLIKTTSQRLVNLTARIEALHPYEVPEIVAVPIEGGSERYLAWLGQTVATGGPAPESGVS